MFTVPRAFRALCQLHIDCDHRVSGILEQNNDLVRGQVFYWFLEVGNGLVSLTRDEIAHCPPNGLNT
jgi:hypothetical protein